MLRPTAYRPQPTLYPRIAVAVLLIGAAFMGVITAIGVWRITYVKPPPAEIANAPVWIGSGVVVSKGGAFYYPGKGAMSEFARLSITLRIDGHTVCAPAPDDIQWADTRIGDTVLVTYKTDQYGNIYVQDWRPQANR